jgi:hypothetical protein
MEMGLVGLGPDLFNPGDADVEYFEYIVHLAGRRNNKEMGKRLK